MHDGKIYVACGTVAWFDEFEPKTRQRRELPNAPRVRDHFSAVASDGRMFLVGGRNTSHHELGNFTAIFGAVVPEADGYEFESGPWSTFSARLDVPTAAGGLAVLDGSIDYFGGETAQKVAHSETHRIDPETGEVTLAAPLERGRQGGGATVLAGKIYFATGSGCRRGGPELSLTEIFDPKR